MGVNVFVVLLLGIASGSLIMVATGATAPVDLLANMGSGAAGMFETTMVAVLVSAICALIREHGGFTALLNGIKSLFKSRKGGQLGMGLLVGAMDISTANNTVAIVMANPIAADMAKTYGITPRKTASILDTFSCVFQGIIPYGAQMLVAISAASELGYAVSAFQIIPLLFYPFLLLLSSLAFIFLVPEKKERSALSVFEGGVAGTISRSSIGVFAARLERARCLVGPFPARARRKESALLSDMRSIVSP